MNIMKLKGSFDDPIQIKENTIFKDSGHPTEHFVTKESRKPFGLNLIGEKTYLGLVGNPCGLFLTSVATILSIIYLTTSISRYSSYEKWTVGFKDHSTVSSLDDDHGINQMN